MAMSECCLPFRRAVQAWLMSMMSHDAERHPHGQALYDNVDAVQVVVEALGRVWPAVDYVPRNVDETSSISFDDESENVDSDGDSDDASIEDEDVHYVVVV